MAQTIQDLFKKSSEYDQKHINNLSNRRVPQALLDAVENGCSYETLKQLAKGFPICRYQTQITVHGIFGELKNRCVGGYVNLTKNKNQSLGIRWTAIDHEKKSELFNAIRMTDKDWIIREDSQQFYMEKIVRVTSKEEYQQKLQEFRQKAESIDTSLFTGWASAYGAQGMWGMVYVVLNFTVQCFPVENMQRIIENVTCMDALEIMKVREAELARRAEEEACREAEQKAREEENARRRAEYQERAQAWRDANPVPSEFDLVIDYTYKAGDVECYGFDEVDYGKFVYKYRVYYKNFGKLCVAECDKTGKRLKKGHEVVIQKRMKTYVKVAA